MADKLNVQMEITASSFSFLSAEGEIAYEKEDDIDIGGANCGSNEFGHFEFRRGK